MDTLVKDVILEYGTSTDEKGYPHTLTKTFDCLIRDGVFSDIKPAGELPSTADSIINGQGLLLVPGYREMHCHLDKSLMGHKWLAPIRTASVLERANYEKSIVPFIKSSTLTQRASNLINTLLQNGSSSIRSHIDIYKEVGISQLEAVQEAINLYGDKISCELVAFPQHGLFNDNNISLLRDALRVGAQYIGGVDPTVIDGNMEKSLNTTFDLAVEAGVGIDYHLHERGEIGLSAVKMIADLTEKSGLQGKVYISHGFCLRDIEGENRDELAERLKSLGISLISHVPLNDTVPDLNYYVNSGVNIALGSDNILDCWSPFGTGNILERLGRYSEMFVLRTEDELRNNLGLITGNVTPLDKKGSMIWPNQGDSATFNLVEATCTAEAVARRSQCSAVFHKGVNSL